MSATCLFNRINTNLPNLTRNTNEAPIQKDLGCNAKFGDHVLEKELIINMYMYMHLFIGEKLF